MGNLFIRIPVFDQLVSARDLAVTVGKAKCRAGLVGELRGRNGLALFKRLEPTAKGGNKDKTIFTIRTNVTRRSFEEFNLTLEFTQFSFAIQNLPAS